MPAVGVSPVPLILLTNDDGVASAGLSALEQALAGLGEVAVVAPAREQSGVAHALTLHAPLRAEPVGANRFAVEGTPTDCVCLGIHGLLRRMPALVVSGINRGANLGDDVTYSGTVAAAMEAALMGVPALAISLNSREFSREELTLGGEVARRVSAIVLERGLPRDTFLNVNIPAGPPKGYRLTRQGRRRYPDSIVEKQDPRGRTYYWLGSQGLDFAPVEGTDAEAVARGYVSVTPLHLDLTNYRSFDTLRRWDDGALFQDGD